MDAMTWLRAMSVGLYFTAAAVMIESGSAEPSGGSAGEPTQHWSTLQLHILAPAAGVEMITSVLLPLGRGPFPLAVVNHGTTESAEMRAYYPAPAFALISSRLLEHGYAVALPQRPGHGETGGPYLESLRSPRGCDDAHFAGAGYAAAASIEAAVAALLREPFVKKQKVLLVGHSAGAWAALALASRASEPVGAVINFSGGLGGRSFGIANQNCAPDRLAGAAAQYGSTTRVPTLWLYAQNDSYFGPALSRRMSDAFRAAGGLVDYRLLPPDGEDGHYLIYSREAERYWGPIVEQFVTTLQVSSRAR
jgi:pimeloyl-ACP methyl ester carboxylesterase